MKQLFLIVGFIFLTNSVFSQDYLKHTVQTGDTVYSLTKRYGVSEAAIYELNPDAKNGLSIGNVLLIPSAKKEVSLDEPEVEFELHKVRRKETLYSLSKKYNVSVDNIKKYNPILYSEALKKGNVVKIPLLKELETVVSTKNNDTVLLVKQTKVSHIVVSQETKYGIAKKYNITVDELEKQNPEIKDGLKIGQELMIVKVENIAGNDEGKPLDFKEYTVVSNDTFYSLERKLQVTKEQLESWNPQLSDGLKIGMVLTYQSSSNSEESASTTINEAMKSDVRVSLVDSIANYDTRKIALMLPLRLNKVPDSSRTDMKDYVKTNKLLNATLEFYSGAMVAIDSAKTLGISTHVKVFDTRNDYVHVVKMMENEDFSSFEAVIGPMYVKNFEKVSSALEEQYIPVISPITSRSIKMYSNSFQSMPDANEMRDAMINYIDSTRTDSKMFLVSDSKSQSIKDLLKSRFADMTIINARDDEYVVADVDFKPKLDPVKPNWIIVETKNKGLIVNITTALNALKAKYDIKLFTTNSFKEFQNKDVSNYHLANLNYHFPTVDVELDTDIENSFVRKYKETYDIVPNKIATRGFDLTFDVLLRLSTKGNLYNSGTIGITEYVENKFNYFPKKGEGQGMYNDAFYIAHYTENLTIEKVK